MSCQAHQVDQGENVFCVVVHRDDVDVVEVASALAAEFRSHDPEFTAHRVDESVEHARVEKQGVQAENDGQIILAGVVYEEMGVAYCDDLLCVRHARGSFLSGSDEGRGSCW